MNRIKPKFRAAPPRYGLGLVGLTLLALALSGCGGGSPTSGSVPFTSAATIKPTIESSNSATKSNTPASTVTKKPATTSSVSGSVSPSATTSGTTNTTTSTPISSPAIATTPVAAESTGSELAGSGDEPTKAYADPTGQFTFQYPQSWGNTSKPGETVRFTGRDEFISLSITTTNLRPMDFGKADAKALTSASPGFKGELLKAYQVAGTQGAMVSYTWQAGPSPVTLKTVPSSARRYYIPGAGGKMAIFTYSSPDQVYDPAGADDFANAFKWLK